jgi:hypothetical protein
MGDPSVVCKSVGGTAGQNDSCVLSPPDQTADLKTWENILNFRPHFAKAKLRARFGDAWPCYHAIEDALGPLNLDFYPVQVLKLPSIGGTELDGEHILMVIRRNLTDFLDRSIVWFDAYPTGKDKDGVECDEGKLWFSDNPLTALMHFHLQVRLQHVDMGGEDRASVVCGEFASDHWIFSTLKTPEDGNHPVSGNRQFGVAALAAGKSLGPLYDKTGMFFDNKDKDALFIFTRGADRVTNVAHQIGSETVFAGGHACWLSFQQKIMSWINAHGGAAVIPGFISERWDWNSIKQGGLWHNPSR